MWAHHSVVGCNSIADGNDGRTPSPLGARSLQLKFLEESTAPDVGGETSTDLEAFDPDMAATCSSPTSQM